MDFNIYDEVIVTLKNQGYFNPWDGRREVPIISSSQLQMEKELLGPSESELSESYKQQLFMEKGILAIKKFAGTCVGYRKKLIKIRPFYGLQHPASEYFIVHEDQIEEIRRYHVEKAEKPITVF